MLTGRVSGQAQIRHVQGILTTSRAQLQRDMVPGVRQALRPIKPDIIQETSTLPSRGGYAALLAGAVRVSTSVSSGAVIKASAKVTAKGKREERDVNIVNAGRLRHPVFGNRKVWRTTRVRPGFITRPIDRARDRVVDVAIKARDSLANNIVRG